ncbi:MAG TPA: amino acid permease [Panacibacter sp.]|nr:amino acid permease [Panacibacter sp.]HNP43833.1 amino acid permease [Panacibacter sp.]
MPEQQSFNRTIGYSTAIAIVISSVIGSGIFMRPAEMAGLLGSPWLIFLAWIIAGVFSIFTIMVIAEVGAMMPATGGQYVFMEKMYGRFWAYLYGWANFAVINTAAGAGITFICAQYLEYFFKLPRFSPEIEQSVMLHLPFVGDILPLENFGVKMLTVFLLFISTYVAYRSTKLGGVVQVVFTVAKVLAIGLLIGGLFASGKGDYSNFITEDATIKPAGFALLIAMVAACNGALQALDGAYQIVYMAGEVKNPGKSLPRSLILGLLVCMIIYMLVTASMVYMLPVHDMASSKLVASDAAKAAFGIIGGGIIALLICLSVLGATNALVLCAPRITFAMAEERAFPAWAGKMHPKFKTPGNALVLHFIWMSILVISGSFIILADMYIFIVWTFNLMIIYGLFILRKKMPDAERPYKVWGYPWMPLLALFFNAFYLVMVLYRDISDYISGKTHIMNSVFGLVLTALGIPLYWYFKTRQTKQA